MTHPNVTGGSGGDTLDLGIVTVRLLATAEQTDGASREARAMCCAPRPEADGS